MIRDIGRVTDGFASLERGVDSGKNPSLLPRNQAAWGENVTVRGGYLSPRPGWKRIPLASSAAATALALGKFQGAEFFDDATSRRGLLMVQVEGSLYRLDLTNAGAVVTDVTPAGGANSGILPQVWMVQAENYFVVQDGQSLPIIFDGITTRRAGGDEVPIGSGPMAYGMLRLWVAVGNNYVAGDVAGGPTGVLKFTENDYLAEGGTFSLPMSAGGITAMRFTATPNTGLGQGELLLFTPRAVFSNTAPVDRDTWKNLTQPIQTITVINQGGQSQASTVLVNSDVFMRSTDGIRTVIQAVRNFTSNQWGNTPISSEMKRVLDKDTQFLLPFASAVEFDNRLLMTCQPVPLPNGCYHTGLVALDFDLVTGMGEKLPPAYDGLWTGRQIYRLVKGRFAGVERCLALCRSDTDGFVWEIQIPTPGNNLTLLPYVTISGGGGTGATGTARVLVVSVTINAAGSGYAVGDSIALTSINSALITITAVNGSGGVTSAVLNNGGNETAVPSNPLPTTLLTAIHTVRSAIHFAGPDAGTGYLVGDTLTVVGGTGTAATFQVTTVNGTGGVTGTTLTNPGNYTVLPTNPVATTTSGVGADCLLQLTFGGSGLQFNALWGVRSVTITNPGSGYTSNPTVEFNIGNAVARAVIDYRMELWELTKEGKFDTNLDDDDAPVEERIEWFIETPSYGFNTDRSNPATLKRLETGDLWMDRVTGTVDFTIHYRPDQYPCWSPWYAWQVCAEKCVEIDATGCVITSPEEQYRPRMVLPQPPELSEPVVAKSMRTGYEFSVRLAGAGFARVKLLRLHAKETVEPVANPVVAASEAECLRLTCDCD